MQTFTAVPQYALLQNPGKSLQTMRSMGLWQPAGHSAPLIPSFQPTQYIPTLSSKGMPSIQSTSKRPQNAPLVRQLRNADQNSCSTLLNKAANSRASDLLRYQRQSRSFELTGFHHSKPLTATRFPAHEEPFGLTCINPIHLSLPPSQAIPRNIRWDEIYFQSNNHVK